MEWPAGFDLPISKLALRVSSSMCARNPTPHASHLASGSPIAEIRSAGCGPSSKPTGQGGAWLQRFALADDHEESNGSTVLTFWEAAEIARKLARGDDPVGEVEAGRPLTICEAVAAYERDLKARDAGLENAKWLRYHLTPALMSKPVAMLTQREVRALRDSLIDKVPKRSTVNRFMRAFKACLTLAANDDERITNRKAWKLPALRDTANPRNVILTEPQVRDVVAASYQTGGVSVRALHRDGGDDRRAAGSGAAAHGRRSRSRSSRRPAPRNAKREEGRRQEAH